MGQSILRYRRKPFRSGVDSAFGYWLVSGSQGLSIDHRTYRKGIGLIFPNPASDTPAFGPANAATQMNSETLTRALERVVFSS
jgi:hypothetical protein